MNNKYVTLLTSDNYLSGVILLKESLTRVKSKYNLLCLITDNLSKETINTLSEAKIETLLVDNIETPEIIYQHNITINNKLANTWKNVFTKFNIFKLTQYDKIIFLDADLMLLKNVDHCFKYNHFTAAIDGEYFGLWKNDLFFNSGFMVIQPDINVYNDLIKFITELDPKTMLDYLGKPKLIADQDVLNEYFKEWKEHKDWHLNKYYNVFAPYIRPDEVEDIKANAYFVHFIGVKPWRLNDRNTAMILDTNEAKFISFWTYEEATIRLDLYFKNNFTLNYSEDDYNIAAGLICYNTYEDLEAAKVYLDKVVNIPAEQSRNFNVIKNSAKCLRYKKVLKEIIEIIYKEKILSNIIVEDIESKINNNDFVTMYNLIYLIEKVFKEDLGKY